MKLSDLPPLHASPNALRAVARLGFMTIRERAAELAAEAFDEAVLGGDYYAKMRLNVLRWLAHEFRAEAMHSLAMACLSENEDDIRTRKQALRDLYVYQCTDEYVQDALEADSDEENRI